MATKKPVAMVTSSIKPTAAIHPFKQPPSQPRPHNEPHVTHPPNQHLVLRPIKTHPPDGQVPPAGKLVSIPPNRVPLEISMLIEI